MRELPFLCLGTKDELLRFKMLQSVLNIRAIIFPLAHAFFFL